MNIFRNMIFQQVGLPVGMTPGALEALLSAHVLHHPPQDDDRSAVTFWLPKSAERREQMARAFERLAALFRTAPHATGLD